ncbi:MAG: amidohydrolase family protein [Candidatus Thorarchaeota archaeon]
MNSHFIVLKDADYVIRDSNRIEKNSSIVVNESKIVSIGSYDDLKKEYEFDETIDCNGLAVLPGMINTHTHIHETMMRGLGHDLPFHSWCDKLVFPTARAMEEEGEELYTALTKLTAMEAAASGTTAILEHSVNFAKHHSYTMAKALREFGLRGAIAKGAEDFSVLDQGHVGPIEKELAETETFLKDWQRDAPDDLVQAWVGPSGGKRTVGGCTNEALIELKKMADRFNTGYHIHLAGTSHEIENVKRDLGLPGSVAMAYEMGILDERTSLAHCIWLVEEEMDLLIDTGAKISHCPSCNQICAIGVLPLVELLDKGVDVGLGTDGAPQNDSLDMYRDMRQAVLLQRISKMQANAVSHLSAFKMATETGAKILGNEKLGRLDPGYTADITALRVAGNPYLTPMYEPLETIIYAGSGGRDTELTMVNGKIVYRYGEYPTINATEVINTVVKAAKRIKKHIKL